MLGSLFSLVENEILTSPQVCGFRWGETVADILRGTYRFRHGYRFKHWY